MFHYRDLPLMRLAKIALIWAGCCASLARAEATLVYETTDAAGAKTQHTFSISGRFVRMDSDPREQSGYALFDSGRMVMFFVDEKEKSYTPVRATPPWVDDHPATSTTPAGKAKADPADKGAAAEPAKPAGEAEATTEPAAAKETAESAAAEETTEPAAATTLKATKKKRTVAGKRCRVVVEMAADKPVAEHCMSGTGELGLSTREMMTLSRLFTKTETLDLNLLGVATRDESYASIQSTRAADKASQVLISASRTAIPAEKLRIPRDYKKLEPAAAKAP